MPPKSGTSRARNVDYDDVYDDDDDYYDDYDDDEAAAEGPTEDEQMRVGTMRTREALGDASGFVSDAEIQSALWHYYFDVGKSVSYLKNKLGTTPKQQTPKKDKEKPPSRFDQAASAAHRSAPVTTGKQSFAQCTHMQESTGPAAPPLFLPTSTPPGHDIATGDFFWDVPWGNIPPHRQGNIIIDAPVYRGGLLGGSSKLAALAAKRRKEREEAGAEAAKPNNETNAAISMLDKLAIQAGHDKSTPRGDGQDQRPARARYPVRRPSPSPQPVAPIVPTAQPESPQPAIVSLSPAQRASASMFASTLCGAGNAADSQSPPGIEAFAAPYMQYSGYDSAKGFAGPSPDDIVREAQAKGAGGGRR